MKPTLYTKDQIKQAIVDEYTKEFGQLRDDEKERDGYFVIGFVTMALGNFDKKQHDNICLKRESHTVTIRHGELTGNTLTYFDNPKPLPPPNER